MRLLSFSVIPLICKRLALSDSILKLLPQPGNASLGAFVIANGIPSKPVGIMVRAITGLQTFDSIAEKLRRYDISVRAGLPNRTIFGSTITLSTGRVIPVRWIGEQHVREDLGFIPSFADWVKAIRPEPWMGRAQRLEDKLEHEEVA